jgi:MFS family permease
MGHARRFAPAIDLRIVEVVPKFSAFNLESDLPAWKENRRFMSQSESSSIPPAQPLTLVQWLVVSVAALGFAFDIYELLMMPLIARPAIAELLHLPDEAPQVREWTGYIFWASALSGGFFGLIGGYLTDYLGRRRVLTYSIVLYAFSALAAGFSTSIWMLLILRCTTFIGVCVEFVAAVAWLAELFPNPRQRERILGSTQAFSSLGGLMVTGAYYLCNQYASSLPPLVDGSNAAWRYTLISGVIPAIPLIIIRPFLPESPIWQRKVASGGLHRPNILALFQPAYLRTTIVTTLLFACGYGAAFGAIQLAPRIVPGMLGKEAAELKKKRDAYIQEIQTNPNSERAKELLVEIQDKRRPIEDKVSAVQAFQETGGLLGRIALAVAAMYVTSRKTLLRIFQLPGLIIVPLVFFYPGRNLMGENNLLWMQLGMAAAGFCTVAQFSFWGNYLPLVYPAHLRGTGEGFAANVGGRMIGTSMAFVTTQLAGASFIPGTVEPHRVAFAAGCVALGVYLFGSILTFFLPQPAHSTTHE